MKTTEKTLSCTKCGTQIPFTVALDEFAAAEIQKQIAAYKNEFEKKLVVDAQTKAKKESAVELEDLKAQLKEAECAAELAKQQELKLRKQAREVEQQKQDLDLEIQRRVEDALQQAADSNAKKIAEEHTRQLAEKEKKITDLHSKLVEMERRIAQGSQQTQGEIAELALEKQLKELYPQDEILPIGKGKHGADITQLVRSNGGEGCGRILYERKQTQNWDEKWITKLKADQIENHADVGVIVTASFPKNESRRLYQRDGIWVTDTHSLPGLSAALRGMLLEVYQARKMSEHDQDKRAIVYHYLTGPQFKQRVEAIVDTFSGLRKDLDSEKTAMLKVWAKREKQLELVLKNTVGMWGDLQGIAGASLPKIQTLELPDDSKGGDETS